MVGTYCQRTNFWQHPRHERPAATDDVRRQACCEGKWHGQAVGEADDGVTDIAAVVGVLLDLGRQGMDGKLDGGRLPSLRVVGHDGSGFDSLEVEDVLGIAAGDFYHDVSGQADH